LAVVLDKRSSTKRKNQTGQSIVETALALPLLIMITLALVEMGIVFASYIALANAAREGAVYAMNHSQLAYAACGTTPYPTCEGPIDEVSTSGYITGTRTIWEEYYLRTKDEVWTAVGQPLKAGQLVDLSDTDFSVDRPVVGYCGSVTCHITVTVHYRVRTFSSSMSLPGVNRLGLPNYYQLNYTFGMPVHGP
jgi:hypothetical protein